MPLRTAARTPKALTVTLRDRHMLIVSQETAADPEAACKAAVLMLTRKGELHAGESLRCTGTFEGAEATQVPRDSD